MKYLIEQCIFPIMNGDECIGQGFIADGYFITAAHIIKDCPKYFVKIGGITYKPIEFTPVFQGERDIWNDETQHDVIMYKFNKVPSPLHLSARRVTSEDILRSYCMFIRYDDKSNLYYNELSVEEVILKNQGTENYLWCEANRFEGSSGSPLLIDNEVVGIMHSGNNNGVCTFLKVRSFILPPEPRKYKLFDKPSEPWAPKYFNKKAEEQINDAFE